MVTPATCLWLHEGADEAAAYYVEVFDDAQIESTLAAPEDTPGAPAGSAVVVQIAIAGHRITLLNGGDAFTLTPAASIEVRCGSQEEADRYRDRLIGDGGEEDWCGWLTDRFGVSWQVYPERLAALLSDADPGRAARAMSAMRTMRRIDIAAIEAAMDADGTAA